MSCSIHYQSQAEVALGSLGAEERNRVPNRIHQLGEFRLSEPNVALLNGLSDKDSAYVLRAENDLSVVFTAVQNSITVLDVLNMRFAQRYG
jgi:hypothetical protein